MSLYGFTDNTSLGKLMKVRTIINEKFNEGYDPNTDEKLKLLCKDLRVEILVIKTGTLKLYCVKGTKTDG